MKTRVVFFGTPAFAVPFLTALVQDPNMDVVAVVTQPDKPVGRKQVLTKPPVKLIAESLSVPVFSFTSLNSSDALQSLRALNADIFVVVAYGKLIPKSILDLPPHGCVNVHPSLLPAYRGPSPIQHAILYGDERTAVSIMLLDEGMDTGPVLAQKIIEIDDRETYSSLEKKILDVGPDFLCETLLAWEQKTIASSVQDASRASVTTLLEREDGKINWNDSAESIDRKIRGFETWPGTFFVWIDEKKEIRVRVHNAHTLDGILDHPVGTVIVDDHRVLIVCGDRRGLELLKIQPEGKNPMPPIDYFRGHPSWTQVAV